MTIGIQRVYLSTIVESEDVIGHIETTVFVGQVEVFTEWVWVFIVNLYNIQDKFTDGCVHSISN